MSGTFRLRALLVRFVSTYLRARSPSGLFLGIAVAFALSLAARSSRADEAAARAHFKRGIALYDNKQYAAALAAFQDAYKEKPSAGIKQNIALSLKGLNRPVEAATAFDEALEEGTDSLRPETRAAIEQELAELSKSVATVNLSVVTTDQEPVHGAVVSILAADAPPGATPRPVAPAALRRPIRLLSGIYTFSARAAGHADPPDKKLALVTGAPVDATFVMSPQTGAGASAPAIPELEPNEGFLKIEANVLDAKIRIDGVDFAQRGTWSGKIASGKHEIEVSAPGWKTTTVDVTVSAGAFLDYPVMLQAIGQAPPEYVARSVKAPKAKKVYLVVTGAIDTVSYRLGVPLGEPVPYGTRRSGFVGLALGGRVGYMVAKTFALEMLGELGGVATEYPLRAGDALDSRTSVAHWQLTPMARFVGAGKVRFTAGAGFGLHGLSVESKLAQQGSTLTKTGSGVGFSFLVDAGMQAEVGPVFLELGAFLNVHGVGPVRDNDEPEGRFFYASPATRGGLRLGLGIPL